MNSNHPTGLRHVNVLGIPIAKIDKQQLFSLLKDKIEVYHGQAFAIAYVNAHTCNLFHSDPRFKSALLSTNLIYTDGNGPRVAAWLAGDYLPPRMTGADWIYDLCRWSGEHGIRLFFLGAKPGVAELALKKLKQEFPKINVVDTHHGYWSSEEEDALIERINRQQPDILLIGVSSPFQETWMQTNLHRLRVPVVWCAGGVFDYASGNLARAPSWMRRIGLEWFWRFIMEPRRLGGRYLAGIPIFLARSIMFAIKTRMQ